MNAPKMTHAMTLRPRAGATRTRLRTGVAALALLLGAATAMAASPRAAADAGSSKLITIGGDVTEIVYALGAGDRILAVDTTSKYPAAAYDTKRKVGYMRSLSPEGVLSVGATMILASAGAGPATAVQVLKSASLAYVTVPDTPSANGITAKITTIGKALGLEARSTALVAKVEAELTALTADREKIAKPLKVLFVLSALSGRITIGGRGTSADGIIALAGGVNAAGNVDGYKPIVAEALVAMAPDAVILMQRTDGRGHSADAIRKSPAFKQTPAGRDDRIREIDGLYLLGFGPRTPAAAREVMHWLYPKLAER